METKKKKLTDRGFFKMHLKSEDKAQCQRQNTPNNIVRTKERKVRCVV